MKNAKLRLAIVLSRFNTEITQELLAGAQKRCHELGLQGVNVVEVPGAIEIPLTAQVLAQQNNYDAIVCLGCVIRGETSHYDYVCQQVSYGCQRVALDFSLPIIFGVLTTENEAQALDRIGGQHGHKGVESVDAAVEMVERLHTIKQQHNPRTHS